MCGIVGYIGSRLAKDTVLQGLKRLEYRGYDSAGICMMGNPSVQVYKEKGKLVELEKMVEDVDSHSTLAIGHTRWATHGQPNQTNAHPHQSASGRFTLVHNGIIENYKELKATYLADIEPLSDTDTEIIVHLVEHFSEQGKSTEETFQRVLHVLEGSFAISMIDLEDPDTIYAAKNKSPLLAGIGRDGENMVASDATAMIHVTDVFKELQDQEYVIVRRNELIIKDFQGNIVERETYTVDWDISSVEMGAYEHFMLKEIDEQPAAIRNLITEYQDEQGQLKIGQYLQGMTKPTRIYIIACGTSHYAGLVGQRLLEKISGIPTESHIASEYLYEQPIMQKDSLYIFISQSGETADSRGVLNKIKQNKDYQTLTVTNVQGSTLYRESDYKLLIHAGPEIAVASSKAYTAQIGVLALLAIHLAQENGHNSMSDHQGLDMFQELRRVSVAMDAVKDQKSTAENIADQYLKHRFKCFYIGRLIDYSVCLEGALKLKEISYIQAEGYAGGELKHGPIALIEDGTPIFVLITDPKIAKNTRSNAQEVLSRGGVTCTIAAEGVHEDDDAWVIPNVHPLLTPLVSVIPLQLIAYYAALQRGCDVDKPRNLAKSVTVE